MQHRQQIRDQLGVLEERLEELGALASSNEQQSLSTEAPMQFGSDVILHEALDSIRDLSHLVHEQQLFKSVNAPDFLKRICSLLIQDAATQGCEIAISHFGEGKISLEMAELVMGAILAGLRASLKSHKGYTPAQRLKQHLFPIGSVYLEVRATSGEVQFRILDDGLGIEQRENSERFFQKLREHVARCGGWFGHSTFGAYGGLIEFKVPLIHNRIESLVLKDGDFEVLIPSSCVAEVAKAGFQVPEDAVVFRLDENDGLVPGGERAPVLLRVGVADLQFWLGCEAISGNAKVRRVAAEDFVEEGSWLKTLGVFQEGVTGRALPLLDGAALIYFHKVSGEEA